MFRMLQILGPSLTAGRCGQRDTLPFRTDVAEVGKVFERENVIGLLLLGLCVAAGGVIVYGIATDTSWRFTGPSWLGWGLMILFLGGVLFGLFKGPGRRWPDPATGRRRRWPWSRGEDEDGR